MKKFALEIRLYPISKFLQSIYNDAVNDIMDIIHKYGLKIGVLSFLDLIIKRLFCIGVL